MKNSELLKTGGKPAPGDLLLLQGFINTLDIEEGQDEIGDPQALKSWLLRHGLIGPTVKINDYDFKTLLSFREALRDILTTNNGGSTSNSSLQVINRLAAKYRVTISFTDVGLVELTPSGSGIEKVTGRFLVIAVKSSIDGSWKRLKACHMPDCRWVFYDGSKNRSGRWCSMSVCGSRDKARRYRKRKAIRN